MPDILTPTELEAIKSARKQLADCNCQEGHRCVGYHEETDEYEWGACSCLPLRIVLSALDRLARDYDLLWRACNEDTPDECPDGCDSYGHVENCKYLDMAEAIIKLKAENDRLAKDALTSEEAADLLDYDAICEAEEMRLQPTYNAILKLRSIGDAARSGGK